MTDTGDRSPPAGDAAQDAAELAQSVGQSLNMALLYGAEHKVSKSSFQTTYHVVSIFLERYGHLDIGVIESELVINGLPVKGAPLASVLAARLQALNLLSLVIDRGFSLGEYEKLLAVLLSPPSAAGGKGASDWVMAQGFEHLQPKAVEYRRVTEGEVAAAPPPPAAGGGSPPAGAASVGAPAQGTAGPDLDRVVAFLKGAAIPDDGRARDDIRQLASDAEKLAELVLRAVEIRERAVDLSEGETLGDLVVGCIGRLLGEVSKSGTARTERGRKQLKKTLLLLERSLLERLRAIAGDEAAGAAEALIEQTAESLDTEAATSKYIKDRRAMTQSSEKLRRLIAQTGDDVEQREALRQSLMEQGLSGEDWHELVVSGPGAEPAPEGGAGVSDIRTLTMLLSKLGDAVRQSREAPAGEEKTALNSLAAEVSGQVQALATSAETKIEKLRRILYVPAGEAGPGSKALSRRELVEILAEIGQEFSQPLTVVVAALDTLNEEAAGELTERQKLLLSVAAESGSRLTHLVNCLMRIVGYPKSLSPEQTVLDALYEGAERP